MNSKQFRSLITSAAQGGDPVVPRCPHAGPTECGGCAFQDRAYADQVVAKAQALTQLWRDDPAASFIFHPSSLIDVVASPDPYNYRTRMDYVATKGRFGLRRRGRFNYIIDLVTCHLIPPPAFAAALALWRRANELGLPDYDIRSHQGFLRYLVVRRSPDDALLLAAVTAAGPHDDAMAALAALALAQPGVASFHWLLNDTLTDVSFGTPLRHWGAATLPMRVGKRTLQIGPNTFFQNNVHLLLPLLDAVRGAVAETQVLQTKQDIGTNLPPSAFRLPPFRVADLYGGVGTIALHLADDVGRVVTVESVAESAALARQNIADAGVGNVDAVQSDVLPFLRDQSPGTFEVIVADPPRTGLGPEVCAELLRLAPRRIVYVSCNPLTQREDAAALAAGYTLSALRGYDMFPHTPHVETLGVFDKRAVDSPSPLVGEGLGDEGKMRPPVL
ncbi:MAG: class I SAM-dependent RNA methyltransferase [Chloroflexales bacterium]|nr:class I SAM-dependent RNA methyltransferase [Chloroflexales bacterium]